MRDLKFRAWDKSGNEPRMVSWEELKPYPCEVVFLPTIQPHIVTLMQFTGLRDKNDKDIFEGDIVKTIDAFGSRNGKVAFDPRMMSWCIAYISTTQFGGRDLFESAEIVGNIYENRELLT